MSTRSNTVVIDEVTGDKKILYRHYDGYLSGAGVDLLNCLRMMKIDFLKKDVQLNAETVADYLLMKTDVYEDDGYISGDVEYIYEVTISNGKVDVKAFTTKMFAGDNDQAVKNADVTNELMVEWSVWCQEHGITDYLSGSTSIDMGISNSMDTKDKVKKVLDDLWENELRDKVVEKVFCAIKDIKQ